MHLAPDVLFKLVRQVDQGEFRARQQAHRVTHTPLVEKRRAQCLEDFAILAREKVLNAPFSQVIEGGDRGLEGDVILIPLVRVEFSV